MRSLNSCRAVLGPLVIGLSLIVPVFAQMRHTSAAPDLNQHIFICAPLVGAGTKADPKRPMFIPAQGLKPVLPVSALAASSTPRTGILAYHAQISDDGKFAIVELVAPSLSDFREILTSSDSRVQVFRKGVHGKDQIEAAFRVYKKDFSFDKFRMMGVR